MNHWKSILLTAILSAAVALPLLAEDRKGPKGPCFEEVETICEGIKPGDGRLRECIKENKDKFSPECQAKMKKHHEMMMKVREACQADKAKLCPDAEPGKGLRACFKENKDKLSNTCKAAMKEMREKRKENKGNKNKGGY